ncbi:amidase signature domain-containing protein [Tirmania nivea]|nr:amidase signature domain-containing protein [Tirmania nivea]
MSIIREVERCLAGIRSHNGFLNAFTNLRPTETLLKEAAVANQRIKSNQPLSRIDGRIIAVKDNICTDDVPTTCASEILREYRSPFQATVVARLNTSGAIVVGKTNMDEFGMGSHSIYSTFGMVKRPQPAGQEDAPFRSAGGSSGGSAVAVAADLCDGALGTDTGGSVRLPAAYCGIYGLKPSYGMVSRWGVVAYSNSLDTVGVLARDSKGVEDIFNAISGYDEMDPTSLSDNTRNRIKEVIAKRKARNKGPLRIGVPLEYNLAELTPPILATWKHTLTQLSLLGHPIVPISLPTTKHALSTYYILAASEASSNLSKFDGLRFGTRSPHDWDPETQTLFAPTRKNYFGDEVRRRILLGTYSLSAEAMGNYFVKAQRVRRGIRRDFDAVFGLRNMLYSKGEEEEEEERGKVDVLITPTSLSMSPRLKDVLAQRSPLDSYVNDVLTVPASLAGIPAMSIPVGVVGDEGREEGEKVGMQLLAQFGDEEPLFEIAKALEGL